jgi:carbamate kinase
MQNKIALVAIGGNSLIRAGQRGSIDEQFKNIAVTCDHLVDLYCNGYLPILTHGNGPQVGAQLLRSELAAPQVFSELLNICVADTQGSIGFMIQSQLYNAFVKKKLKDIPRMVTIITQVIVDQNDPAFQNYSKPIGPFYTFDESEAKKKSGWQMIEDSARGYRRVVPSPQPKEIVEKEVIKHCVENDYIVIAGGGGGIPVIIKENLIDDIEAVIDKDKLSALLATIINADLFVISTDAPYVYLNYKKNNQTQLEDISSIELEKYFLQGQFPAGSMGPKIESALEYLKHGGKQVIITTPENIISAVKGEVGTRIYP